MKRTTWLVSSWMVVALTVTTVCVGASHERTAGRSREQEAREIGAEAYIYLYPLVIMDVTRRQMTNLEAGRKPGMGPMNAFHHFRAYPDARFRAVVRPNFDTLYSILWADLTAEPLVVSVPDSGGRYYLLPMMDMWTDIVASPGWRTTGTGAGHFAFVPPGWRGRLPDGVTRIDVPTPYGWMIGRTQTNGPKDYANVHRFQNGLKATPLSQWGKEPSPVTATIDPTMDMKTPPKDQVNQMPAKQFFQYGARLMKLHQPHREDGEIVARMARIGIVAGEDLDFDTLDPVVQTALRRGAVAGQKAIRAKVPTLGRIVNGWAMLTDTMGVYGKNYLKRACIAMVGLGANKVADAVYPLLVTDANGKTPTGENNYVLHFEKGKLPPAGAFWSVTMYDKEGFPVPNAINRFAIGDRDALRFNDDGSLDLYIQTLSPGRGKISNWLPSPPSGALGVTMRIYAPRPEVLDGTWSPPPLKRAAGKLRLPYSDRYHKHRSGEK